MQWKLQSGLWAYHYAKPRAVLGNVLCRIESSKTFLRRRRERFERLFADAKRDFRHVENALNFVQKQGVHLHSRQEPSNRTHAYLEILRFKQLNEGWDAYFSI
jgi:hypothetical protein